MHHANMNHAAMMGNNTAATPAVLTESGTDPFATIQEVITALEANPDTNWEKVNIEALRLHLVEMQDMTLNIDVTQTHIDNGFKAVVAPTSSRAVKSLTRVLSAHPAQMKAETGWDMQVQNNNGVFTLTVTTDNVKDVAKIRGLGYIGVMAYGNHHQPHHWAMASGDNPHAGHSMKH
ncbi:MAG: hypothetical protein ABGX45_05455, partial [Candidatus Thioglobus sp.]